MWMVHGLIHTGRRRHLSPSGHDRDPADPSAREIMTSEWYKRREKCREPDSSVNCKCVVGGCVVGDPVRLGDAVPLGTTSMALGKRRATIAAELLAAWTGGMPGFLISNSRLEQRAFFSLFSCSPALNETGIVGPDSLVPSLAKQHCSACRQSRPVGNTASLSAK